MGEELELPVILLALVIAAVTFSASCVRSATFSPLALLLVAAPILIASRGMRTPLLEATLLIVGAVLLSIAHVLNLRSGHVCSGDTREATTRNR